MHVIFVEPAFPRNQREFPRALKAVGARVTGIGEAPIHSLDAELRGWLDHYEQVSSVCNVAAMTDAVRRIQKMGWVDRIEATVEAHITPTAKVREATSIPGTSTETAWLCRDKPSMKEALRAAGVPCAQSLGTSSMEEARAFAAKVGYPIIVKPRDGAGAAGTYKCADLEQLERALVESAVDRGGSAALEEFIEGHEGFYDTLCVNGDVVHEFVTHYYPNVLEAMRHRWISPQFIATNRVDAADGYQEVKDLGRKVIDALGIGTSATHMEWFAGKKGLTFSEIGCRPPGVSAWDLYGTGNDMDMYVEWASLLVHGRPSQQPSRRYSAGIINLRPTEDGTIVGYEGLDKIRAAHGPWIIDYKLPEAGTPTQPVEAGYMANAWVRMRHPDFDELRRMLTFVGETVKVIAR